VIVEPRGDGLSFHAFVFDIQQTGSVQVAVPANAAQSVAGIGNRASTPADSGFVYAPWHNSANAFDVTGDGMISPLDSLASINHINARQGDTKLDALPGIEDHLFLDVIIDGHCRPNDVLAVVNEMNRKAVGGGLGNLVQASDHTVPSYSNAVSSARLADPTLGGEGESFEVAYRMPMIGESRPAAQDQNVWNGLADQKADAHEGLDVPRWALEDDELMESLLFAPQWTLPVTDLDRIFSQDSWQ
jgi:hypothetical protein